MTVTSRFLYSRPQREIASLVRDRLARCRSAEVVSGFVTPDGVEALRAGAAAGRITRFVLGAATFKAFEALDDLIDGGLALGSVRVHLGHTRATGGRKHPFARYRPMLHSKVFLFEMPNGMAAAFVGSHNITSFALRGLNGEAGVLLEGAFPDPVFAEIRAHLAESFRQAAPYDPSLKEAYAQWLREYLDQLGTDATDMPRDGESTQTVVLFASLPSGRLPQGERIYFELDQRLTQVNAIKTEVHLHLFRRMPRTPAEALARSGRSDAALVGKVEAIDAGAGSAEVNADWFIDNPDKPELKITTHPFRPKLSMGKQQVRAHVSGKLSTRFDYLFDAGRGKWVPLLDQEELHDEQTNTTWSRVTGFREAVDIEKSLQMLVSGRGEVSALQAVLPLREISPESGSFVLFSRRRRRLGSR